MIVYRYTTEEELKLVLKGEKDKLGNFNNEKNGWSKSNTHKYQTSHKYLHFFKDKSAIEFLKKVRKHGNIKMYICGYDIPKSVLRACKGKGVYDSGASGYDCLDVKLTEYAIDVNDFVCDWLVTAERVRDDSTEAEVNESELYMPDNIR